MHIHTLIKSLPTYLFPYAPNYRFGNCVPYEVHEQTIPCDAFYTPGVDHIYVSYQRLGGDFDRYINVIEQSASLFLAVFQDECRDPAIQVLCHFFLPPCGNSTVFEPPTSVCKEACNYLREICPSEWEQVVAHFEANDDWLAPNGLHFINCSNTGEYLDPLPYCCSDVGVDIRMFSSFVHMNAYSVLM